MIHLSNLLLDAFRRNDNKLISKHIDQFLSLYKIDELNECLVKACAFSNVTVIKQLLGDELIAKYIDFKYRNNQALDSAFRIGNIDILKFILYSPELIKRPVVDDKIMHTCFNERKNMEVIKFLIFEVNIPKSKYVKKLLKFYPDEQVEKWFALRDLEKKLSDDLPNNDQNNTIKKVKI